MFWVRLHCIDYCLAVPTAADFKASRAPINSPGATGVGGAARAVRVPVIRIFGAAADGQTVCAHVHGIFPYLYVPFDGFSLDDIDDITKNVRNGIDRAVGNKAVLAVILVRGVPFYGFHVGFRPYLKIYLYDPSYMARVAELFRKGRVAGLPALMPHEAHIPFVLQFMTDYNLYGCDIVEAATATPRPAGNSEASCVEVDIFAQDIQNRHAVPERRQHEAIPEAPVDKKERLVYSLAAVWREMAAKYDKKGVKNAGSRRLWEMISTQEAFAQLGATSSDARRTPVGWMHEDEYREQVDEMIEAERAAAEAVEPRPSFEHLPTLREAVETFYPERAKQVSFLKSEKRKQQADGSSSIETQETQKRKQVRLDSSTERKRQAGGSRTEKKREEPFSQTPSPDFPLSTTLDRVAFRAPSLSEWLESSPEMPRKHTEGHALSQVFPVVKSSFPREQSDKSDSPYEFPPSGQLPREPPSGDGAAVKDDPSGQYIPSSYDDRADVLSGDGDVPSGDVPSPSPPKNGGQLHSAKWKRPDRSWQYAIAPPTRESVEAWLEAEAREDERVKKKQAEEARAAEEAAARSILPKAERDALRDALRRSRKTVKLDMDMRVLCVEVHAQSRGTFLPNPERDAIEYVFWRTSGGGGGMPVDGAAGGLHMSDRNGGVLSVNRPLRDRFTVDVLPSERELLRSVVRLVHALDPDILAGYEVKSSSWGYLGERAVQCGLDLWQELGRVQHQGGRYEGGHHEQGQVTGRYVLSIQQAMRASVDLRQYTLEDTTWHVLGRRIPFYRSQVLAEWSASGRARDASRLVHYYRRRVAVGVALMAATELVSRTSEQARILGTDFGSVLERGSQFKVESVMLRVAKPENYVMPSPSREQVGAQRAAACQPLVLEPRSGFYRSPVVVLDFTSLYPSLVIAYNLCYSTYVGGLNPYWEGGEKGGREKEGVLREKGGREKEGVLREKGGRDYKRMGFTTYERPLGVLEELRRLGLVIAPTGSMYAGAQTRQSLLAKMLGELLDTRAMVKAAMAVAGTKAAAAASDVGDEGDSDVVSDASERQRLHNRQLALKLLANVTYGYTSASFSGRMPCVEVADSIVQAGRQTLERAIALIHSVRRWRAEVVYGDTDSVFVHLPGRTRAEAFAIGAEMAAAVTGTNLRPVRLTLEKVYEPCVLMAKKRYAGCKYERAQGAGVFEAKGLETVRRDGSPVAAKVLEECLRLLFGVGVGRGVRDGSRGSVRDGSRGSVRDGSRGSVRDGGRGNGDSVGVDVSGGSVDLTHIKAYVQKQFDDVLRGRVSMVDLCFSKEVRAGSYRAPPPGAVVAARRMAQDPRAAVVPGERVPYVVVAGAPGAAVRERCVAPDEVVRNRRLRVDAEYYVRHSVMPPLDRVLRLVGVDVARWYGEMRRGRARAVPATQARGMQTLDAWLQTWQCALCGGGVGRGGVGGGRGGRGGVGRVGVGGRGGAGRAGYVLCNSCRRDKSTMARLQNRVRDAEVAYREILTGCRSCAGLAALDEVRCENVSCAVYYERAERAVQFKAERAKAPLIEALEW